MSKVFWVLIIKNTEASEQECLHQIVVGMVQVPEIEVRLAEAQVEIGIAYGTRTLLCLF